MNQRFIGLAFIMTLWFVISFVTNILGPIMPLVIKDFGLSLALAGFLPFSFFLAYGVVSIPAGLLIERIGAKNALIFALVINLAGASMFAIMPAFATAVLALFVIGMGMAMLQVVINPLTRTVGGEANYPFFSVMGQLVFGLASFVSPWVFQAVMSTAARRPPPAVFVLAPQSLPWVILYWLFLVLFAGAVVLTFIMPLPRVELQEYERVEGVAFYRELLRQPKVWGFFVGIACYVATEQSLANWMSKFLETYHGFSPLQQGASAVAWFWGTNGGRVPRGYGAAQVHPVEAGTPPVCRCRNPVPDGRTLGQRDCGAPCISAAGFPALRDVPDNICACAQFRSRPSRRIRRYLVYGHHRWCDRAVAGRPYR